MPSLKTSRRRCHARRDDRRSYGPAGSVAIINQPAASTTTPGPRRVLELQPTRQRFGRIEYRAGAASGWLPRADFGRTPIAQAQMARQLRLLTPPVVIPQHLKNQHGPQGLHSDAASQTGATHCSAGSKSRSARLAHDRLSTIIAVCCWCWTSDQQWNDGKALCCGRSVISEHGSTRVSTTAGSIPIPAVLPSSGAVARCERCWPGFSYSQFPSHRPSPCLHGVSGQIAMKPCTARLGSSRSSNHLRLGITGRVHVFRSRGHAVHCFSAGACAPVSGPCATDTRF